MLQQVDGKAALDWIKTENSRTQKLLSSDPRYQSLYEHILQAEQSPNRLAIPVQMSGEIWNFWQDRQHEHGIWRSTSEESFNTKNVIWKTRFDLDLLARQEKTNWVTQGVICLAPQEKFCLMELSDAGEDAHQLREFNTSNDRFVPNGFFLPNGKQDAVWMDQNHLIVSRDWGDKTSQLTSSGYPYIVKMLARGENLNQAKEIFRGSSQDMMVAPLVFQDKNGAPVILIERHTDFFHSQLWLLNSTTLLVHRVPVPEKYDGLVYLNGRLVFHLLQDWTADNQLYPADSVVAIDLRNFHHVERVISPTRQQTIGDGENGAIAATSNGLIVVLYENVQPRLMLYKRSDNGSWHGQGITLPHNLSASVISSDVKTKTAYVELEGFIQPPQIWKVDTANQSASLLYKQPDLFDASDLRVEQFFANSKDGTRIPYFIVHKKNWQLKGRNPTLMTAYGGFGLSYLPVYHSDVGISWLNRGGVYVMANIRGGGEFGPSWHDSARYTGRQKAYDDFAAVAQDLFKRKITSPQKIGIRGRSNGGLLMGVEYTQHPSWWSAVVIGVPLLDMLNYEHMAAGASWAAEYGSVTITNIRHFWEKTSPLHVLKAGEHYPEPFIFTSTKDDRVGPVHARLFAARLQELKVPFYYYEDVEGGHAGTVNAEEVAHERAMEAIYLSQKLMDTSQK
ncbi:prolyl oligopeptidase family serine peptidase [Swingsia samuiensis]|nr:prolyl oligopeptidase family serine peptidase [Swingsia samuiensis]